MIDIISSSKTPSHDRLPCFPVTIEGSGVVDIENTASLVVDKFFDSYLLKAIVTGKVKEKTDALHYRMEHCYSIDHVKIQCELDKITKQRDLAVEALEKIAKKCNLDMHGDDGSLGGYAYGIWNTANSTLSTIKESEAMAQGEKK